MLIPPLPTPVTPLGETPDAFYKTRGERGLVGAASGREEAALWAAGIVSRHLTPVRSSRQSLSAVPPGGNPLQPYGHPTAGANLSRMGEDRTADAPTSL
ncbi:hypothetical protein [uncultured Nostoc sp.]|uniref:hypothetical protein n=1 Tax=uncultured Nostoc sp. TaxID=340711 RepID=UPI002614B426|nr:hypothetical protein [uncultured Nostoc sp.]